MDSEVPATFVTHAAALLGDTQIGLSGSQIIAHTSAWAVDCGVNLPHHSTGMANKRTVLCQNLLAFHGENRYRIIKALCELEQLANLPRVQELRLKLIATYGRLFDAQSSDQLNDPLVEATSHWLANYPEAATAFQAALIKYRGNIFSRNLLDDLRLSLETLVKSILGNDKSLENQKAFLGDFLKQRESSAELRQMFVTLLSYYCSYQNSYVKHNDRVNDDEVEIMFELTSCFLKHLVRLTAKTPDG